ncbi:class I SAM-dependent methyltransferase [Micromonospora sp. M12]
MCARNGDHRGWITIRARSSTTTRCATARTSVCPPGRRLDWSGSALCNSCGTCCPARVPGCWTSVGHRRVRAGSRGRRLPGPPRRPGAESRRAGPRREPPVEAEVADARALPDADDEYDAALLLGPLYHLVRRADRLQALREAVRVTRPAVASWPLPSRVSPDRWTSRPPDG